MYGQITKKQTVDHPKNLRLNQMILSHFKINPDIELNVRKQDAEKYLLLHKWQQVEHPNKRMQVFDGKLDDEGKPIRVVLLVTEDFRDTTLRIYQAVQTIDRCCGC
jgi:hypothetical protein